MAVAGERMRANGSIRCRMLTMESCTIHTIPTLNHNPMSTFMYSHAGPKMYIPLFGFLFIMSASCTSVKIFSKYNLTTGQYRLKQAGRKFEKVTVTVTGDSIEVLKKDRTFIDAHPAKDHYYLQNNLDIDILIAPFKYRPATKNLPRQLTSSFNANIFIGYRLDKYHIDINNTRTGHDRKITHSSVGIGVFGGISSLIVGPWTTNYQIADEYNGLGVCRGIMLLGGVDSLTFGVAAGFDRLTDRDKNVWIYQNKPWYGLTLGLNLN
jgi:hypothetical protein